MPARGRLFASPAFLQGGQNTAILLQLSKLRQCITASLVARGVFHPSSAAVAEGQ